MPLNVNSFGPFHFDIWGSVADWAMVFVTFFTLLYLIKTFRAQASSLSILQKTLDSQLTVQRLHVKSTTIENERFRKENMPSFSVRPLGLLTQLIGLQYVSIFTLEIVLTNCSCRNFKIDFVPIDMELSYREGDVFSHEYLPEDTIYQCQLTARTKDEVYSSSGSVLKVTVYYEDPVNNGYRQFTEIRLSNDGTETTYDEEPTLVVA